MIIESLYAYFATLFFAVVFNAPKKSIFITGINGCIGWLIYSYFYNTYHSPILGSFLGALAVGILSEYLARYFKMPATIFLTSGIIPLVPGTGLYYTMLRLVLDQYSDAAHMAIETIFIAGSIAAAIAISSSLFKKTKRG
ncbi:MAG: threonine/serine exporter family protein [Clostridia bacterium]